MRSNEATIAACVSLVFTGQLPQATRRLFNDTSAEERSHVHYAIVNDLISCNANPATIASYRDMVRGCAHDCGLDDPNVQSNWTDEDHVNSDATRGDTHVIRATADPYNIAAGSGNTWTAFAESARATRHQ